MTRLLLVEDDESYANVLSRRLEKQGFDIKHLSCTDHILSFCQTWLPEVVILDMNLGSHSSLPLISDIRQRLPSAKILLVTGFASIATTVKAIKSGADDYLPKPLDLTSLLTAISKESDKHISQQSMAHAAQKRADQHHFLAQPMLSPERLEWEYIQRVLSDNQGNISQTARQLNMHRRTLQRKLAKKPVAC